MPNPENVIPHQFKPGQSGNLKGKPKGTKHFKTILKRMLEEEIEVKIDGQKHKRKLDEVLMRNLIQAAVRGQKWALAEIIDRIDGKPTQEIETDQNVVINWKKPSYLNEEDFSRGPGMDASDGGDAEGLLPGIQDDSQPRRDA